MKLLLGGQQRVVPAYYAGQNASGSPNHYETVEEANRLRRNGKAQSINRGRALLILGPRRRFDSFRGSQKRGWKVVGQTAKKKPSGPGFPHWSSVE